ncbi:MAG TPA: hypothetical protein VNN73_21380 [Blastocatellia bacterium]|nr:hypothetical protein [Blastocatellia bacterium]
MKKSLYFSFAAALLAACALFTSANAQTQGAGAPEIIRHKLNPHGADALTQGSTTATSPISYHGGPLIGTPTMYIIWYGNWNQTNGSDTPAGQQIVRDFANAIGGSPYFQINQTYSAGATTITGNVVFGGETTDAYSQGKRLRDASILAIVNTAINNGGLPYDPNGVYFVLTSSDVTETSGF